MSERIEEQRANLSPYSRAFLFELMAVIERYGLDLFVPDIGAQLYSLKDGPNDFIEITQEDVLPYSSVYKLTDLSVVIKLMLGIEMERLNSVEDIADMQREE
jgi:hypothetical protein